VPNGDAAGDAAGDDATACEAAGAVGEQASGGSTAASGASGAVAGGTAASDDAPDGGGAAADGQASGTASWITLSSVSVLPSSAMPGRGFGCFAARALARLPPVFFFGAICARSACGVAPGKFVCVKHEEMLRHVSSSV